MLQITAATETRYETPDELGRDRTGYSPTMSPLALYDATHGAWVLGPRAHTERYYLLVYAGVVRQVVEIENIVPVPANPARSVINGTILKPGHPTYDNYFGEPAPNQGNRNPISYFTDDTPAVSQLCGCGCGEPVAGRPFRQGHDQTALHQRVAQIGTVEEFLRWFDIVRGSRPPVTSA